MRKQTPAAIIAIVGVCVSAMLMLAAVYLFGSLAGIAYNMGLP